MSRAMRICVMLMLLGGSIKAQMAPPPAASGSYHSRFFTGEIFVGYYAGVGIHAAGTISNLAQGLPIELRLGLGYSWVGTGDAERARRVFIDQNTNGSARSRGKMWDGRLDLLIPVKFFGLERSRLFGGLRRNHYTAYFEYIGGNETFDVNCNQWGTGGGIETTIPVSRHLDMLVTAGADYYFRGTLSGHDTYYRPNGDDLHAKEDFTYRDADATIAQPNFNSRVMFGVAYRF